MISADREQILKWDIEQLWNACQILQEDEETSQQDLQNIQAVKHGIKVKVPIYYILQEWFETYPNTKRAKIYGYGKYSIHDFMEEIETRTQIMRSIIYNNTEESASTEPR